MYYKLNVRYHDNEVVCQENIIVSKTRFGLREIMTKQKIEVIEEQSKIDMYKKEIKKIILGERNLPFVFSHDVASPVSKEEIESYIDKFSNNHFYCDYFLRKRQRIEEEKKLKKQIKRSNKEIKQKIKTVRKLYYK